MLLGKWEISDKKASENYEKKAKQLLEKTNRVYYDNLADYEYGMPYADENILRAILSYLVELGLTTPGKIKKVLQFLPKNH